MSGWLADTSAIVRWAAGVDAAAWADRVGRGLVRWSTPTRLELGLVSRSGAALRSELGRPPLSLLLVEHLTPQAEERAVQVQALLADQGQRRPPSVPDLLVAAVAERAGLTVLHVDKDFDLIAGVTGQPVERLRLTADHPAAPAELPIKER